MRVGYGLITCQRPPGEPRSPAEIYRDAIELAVEAERLGFTSVWTSEHHFVDDEYLAAQLPLLAAIAARTSSIRLGTGVILAPLFDPLHLAEDATAVDLISGGRLILGVGIGWRDEEFAGFGIASGERVSRLEGTVAVLRQAWSDGLVTGDRRRFRYNGLNVTPKPARPGGPPIWIGGSAEPAVRRAGRIADGYFASSAPPPVMAQRMAWVREEAEAAGRDPSAVTAGAHRIVFAWRDGDAWSRIRDAVHYISWKYDDMTDARGSRVPRAAPPLDASTEAALRDRVIVGTPEEVAEGIAAYRDVLGAAGEFVCRSYFPGIDPGLQREALRIIGEEVLPLVR